METENSRLHAPAPRPHRPGVTPQPISRRPVVDGFVPRQPGIGANPRPAAPVVHKEAPVAHKPIAVVNKPITVINKPTPQVASKPLQVAPSHPVTHKSLPTQAVKSHPTEKFMQHPTATSAPRAQAPDPLQREFVPEVDDELGESSGGKGPKEPNATGHAGLVGSIVFVLLGAALLSPFLPGKTMQNLPLSSSNFSTGDQVIACAQNLGNVSSDTKNNTKLGAPLTFSYSTSTTQTASCNGTVLNAVTGHTSLFSPLALLADLAVALIVAVVVAKVWRLIFGKRRSKR